MPYYTFQEIEKDINDFEKTEGLSLAQPPSGISGVFLKKYSECYNSPLDDGSSAEDLENRVQEYINKHYCVVLKDEYSKEAEFSLFCSIDPNTPFELTHTFKDEEELRENVPLVLASNDIKMKYSYIVVVTRDGEVFATLELVKH